MDHNLSAAIDYLNREPEVWPTTYSECNSCEYNYNEELLTKVEEEKFCPGCCNVETISAFYLNCGLEPYQVEEILKQVKL